MSDPYDIRKASDGRFYYVEVGAQGEDMNVSQMYETKEHAEEGRDAAIKRASESGAGEKPSGEFDDTAGHDPTTGATTPPEQV